MSYIAKDDLTKDPSQFVVFLGKVWSSEPLLLGEEASTLVLFVWSNWKILWKEFSKCDQSEESCSCLIGADFE